MNKEFEEFLDKQKEALKKEKEAQAKEEEKSRESFEQKRTLQIQRAARVIPEPLLSENHTVERRMGEKTM